MKVAEQKEARAEKKAAKKEETVEARHRVRGLVQRVVHRAPRS